MRGFFLLLLSLTTGCEAWTEVKGCVGGWVEFTCKCSDPEKNYHVIHVINGTKTVIKSTKPDEWETEGRVSVYHDRNERSLRVLIKQLQTQDDGEWKCKFGSSSNPPTDTITLSLDQNGVPCEGPFIHTAYKKTKTTISCEYPNHEYDSDDMFFCKEPKKLREQKENSPFCEDVSFDEKFNRTETDRGFRVSISEVSSQHQGVYWCGLKSERYRAGVRKIDLKTEDIHVFERKTVVGETVSYWCKYLEGARETKFICKGDDPSVCQTLISSNNLTSGRFSMKDDPEKRNITITVRDVRAEDNGTYWCGAKSTNNTHSDIIYHKLFMNVETPDQREVGAGVIITWTVRTAIILLLFLLTVFIYKRFSELRRRRNEAAAHPMEELQTTEGRQSEAPPVLTVYCNTETRQEQDGAYEEIQE